MIHSRIPSPLSRAWLGTTLRIALLVALGGCSAARPNVAHPTQTSPSDSEIEADNRATREAAAQTLDALQSAQVGFSRVVGIALQMGAAVWLVQNDSCPTAEQVLEANNVGIENKRSTSDAWDTPFRISCDLGNPVVRSAGPDGLFGTDDDIVVGEQQ